VESISLVILLRKYSSLQLSVLDFSPLNVSWVLGKELHECQKLLIWIRYWLGPFALVSIIKETFYESGT
jgi:hypothetical protein